MSYYAYFIHYIRSGRASRHFPLQAARDIFPTYPKQGVSGIVVVLPVQ